MKEINLLETKKLEYLIQFQNEIVGEISLQQTDEEVTILFSIEPKYQHMGFASAAVQKLTKYVHESLGIKNIHAYITENQDIAKHVLEHNGYERNDLQDGRILYVHHLEETLSDESYQAPHGHKVLYLAGGCFWGMEKAFRALNGITDTVVGYANGTLDHPTYEEICHNETGFRETIRITFDPTIVSLDTVLKAYFICIHPEQEDGQGNDIGSQYQTGIYYRDDTLLQDLQNFINQEKKKYRSFYVELKPLENFWLAEEYHQDYLSKIPDGYCHISTKEIEEIKKLNLIGYKE